MNKARQPFAILCIIFLMSTLLLACSSTKNDEGNAAANTAAGNTAATAAPTAEATAEATAEPAATTRSYTDYKGHTVEIPVDPQRIIYSGKLTAI